MFGDVAAGESERELSHDSNFFLNAEMAAIPMEALLTTVGFDFEVTCSFWPETTAPLLARSFSRVSSLCEAGTGDDGRDFSESVLQE